MKLVIPDKGTLLELKQNKIMLYLSWTNRKDKVLLILKDSNTQT